MLSLLLKALQFIELILVLILVQPVIVEVLVVDVQLKHGINLLLPRVPAVVIFPTVHVESYTIPQWSALISLHTSTVTSRRRKIPPSLLFSVNDVSGSGMMKDPSSSDDNERKQQRQQSQSQQELERKLQVNYNIVMTALYRKRMNNKLSLVNDVPNLIPIEYTGGYVQLPTSIKGTGSVSTRSVVSTTPTPSTPSQTQSSSSMIRCIVVQRLFIPDDVEKGSTRYRVTQQRRQQPSLVIPLLDDTDYWLLQQQLQLKLQLQQQQQKSILTISKYDLRRQNSIIINHPNNGLYDNLPYHWWNDDNNNNNGNNNLNKRECYNIFLGKDWYLWNTTTTSTTLSLSEEVLPTTISSNNNSSLTILQNRIRQVQIQEYQSQIAECDAEIAYFKQQQQLQQQQSDSLSESSSLFSKEIQYWQTQRGTILQLLKTTMKQQQQQQQQQLQPSEKDETKTNRDDRAIVDVSNIFTSTMTNFISKLQGLIIGDDTTTATTLTDDSTTTRTVTIQRTPYTSTYDMIWKCIIQEKMNANIIGIVLENTSLLNIGSGITMGGLIILQKQQQQKETIQLMGEKIFVTKSETDSTTKNKDDDDVDESIYLLECHVDEAIGMSIACNIPLWVEQETWERGTIMCRRNDSFDHNGMDNDDDTSTTTNYVWYTNDPELSILFERQSANVSNTERVAPIRIPRITNLYDSITMIQQVKIDDSIDSTRTKDLFPTDNIIQSLAQYDAMSLDDKVRVFMAMSNTQQVSLPRRRNVVENPNIFDELLLPYIDESVRFEYNVRIAQQMNDTIRLQELLQQQSERSKARMKLEMYNDASTNSNNDKNDIVTTSKEILEKEVELYTSLRADITQDVGSYSSFLDRDEWYERTRQKMVQRMKQQQEKKNKQM